MSCPALPNRTAYTKFQPQIYPTKRNDPARESYILKAFSQSSVEALDVAIDVIAVRVRDNNKNKKNPRKFDSSNTVGIFFRPYMLTLFPCINHDRMERRSKQPPQINEKRFLSLRIFLNSMAKPIKQEICEGWLTSDFPAFNHDIRKINKVIGKQEVVEFFRK